MYFSWFSICRIIKLAPKVNRSVFDSIILKPDKDNRIGHINELLDYYFEGIVNLYMPWLRATKIVKGIKWKPTWKSVPNDDRRMKAFPGAIGNIFSSFKYEITAFANLILNFRMYSPFGVRKGQAGIGMKGYYALLIMTPITTFLPKISISFKGMNTNCLSPTLKKMVIFTLLQEG